MANIVQGMFGTSPSQVGQDRYDTGFAQDLRAVQLDPMQQANLALRQGGRGIAQGALAPMLGVQDVELQKAQMAQQLASQYDITSPDGLKQYAQALAQNGMPEFAQIAVTKAQDMETKGLSIQQSQLNIKKTEQATTREEQLREALAALPADATEEDYLRVYRQFGSADQMARITEASISARNKLGAAQNKPLPASLQKSEDKDLEAIDSYKAQSETLQPSIAALTQDEKGARKLNLDPVSIAKYISRNAIGESTPESRAYAGLKSAVDTAVNLQVSAEKGVQTDKDVLRFANALIAAYGRNDSEATLEALKKYNAAIETAKTRTENRLESRRTSQGVSPYYVEGRDSTKSSAPLGTATNPIVLK
jgi:hypothetical protein